MTTTATVPRFTFRVAGQLHDVWWSATLDAFVCSCGQPDCAGRRRACAALAAARQSIEATSHG